MERFEGFADANGKFFKALARRNERDWFLAHKAEYEAGWLAPMKALLSEVREAIDRAYAHADLDEPRVFRIFRDVRFSKDKSPYKTHIGGFIPLKRSGKKTTDLPMALYFHVGASEIFGAAGHYMMEKESLTGFRDSIVDDKQGKALDKILLKLGRAGFSAHSHGDLKRVPKGYDPEHPRAELLKRKGLTVAFPALPKGILATPKLVKWLADGCKASAPLVEWLAYVTR
jgi:uncharacterized protein (TIGR02453 family)